jgi:hypothetical protein
MQPVSKEQLGKHILAETISDLLLGNGSVNTPTTIRRFLETVFSIRSVQSGYKEEFS